MSPRSRRIAEATDNFLTAMTDGWLAATVDAVRAQRIRTAKRRVEIAQQRVRRNRFAPDATHEREELAALRAFFELTAADYEEEDGDG